MSKILTFGVYDYFHLGHLRLFKQCKEHADYLVVAVQNESGIDILALGEDHIGARFDEIVNWCKEHGKSIVRLKRTPGIASSDIKRELTK